MYRREKMLLRKARYRERNREKIRAYEREWRKKNPEKAKEKDKKINSTYKKRWEKKPENVIKIRAWHKKWQKENKEKVREHSRKWGQKNPEKIRIYRQAFYRRNKDKFRISQRIYKAKKYREDPLFRLSLVLRNRLNRAIKGNRRYGSAIRNLGCSVQELKNHLESQFQQGMTWENWGVFGWHIDHIKPLYTFDLTNPEHVKTACHYTNLRPLWARDNLYRNRNRARFSY